MVDDKFFLMRLTLRQLLLLSSIDECGSLKKAALRVGTSQPQATKALQDIEYLLNRQLFNRTNRGMKATTAGECVIRHARTILSQANNLQEELQYIARGNWAKLRIGTIMGAVPIVTDAVKLFIKKNPNTSVEIIEDTSIELFRQLDRSSLDLIIGRSLVSETPDIYNIFTFYDETLTVIANPCHPLVRSKKLTLIDLSKSRWIVYTNQMPMRISLEHEYRLEGITFPRTLIETRSAFATMSLIQSDSNYIALLAKDVADFFINFGIAKALNFKLKSKSEPYEIITPKNIALPPAANDFINTLIKQAT